MNQLMKTLSPQDNFYNITITFPELWMSRVFGLTVETLLKGWNLEGKSNEEKAFFLKNAKLTLRSRKDT